MYLLYFSLRARYIIYIYIYTHEHKPAINVKITGHGCPKTEKIYTRTPRARACDNNPSEFETICFPIPRRGRV